ncbi:MAG: hypothetical protein A3G20_00685 [Acidobacteria bacterium RIFCSPLOWO2_12_FULL_59_11]|nr:MAG: hypothetical protein A3G20_00685 [Acidobacteria bacterium RIFCSPLOWO2_12_FULL_59_11]
MDTSQFTSHVKKIPVAQISPNPENPRGPTVNTKDPSFERLVTSISQVGILVPIVVRELPHPKANKKYELVDGERRYWAAVKLRREEVPAHVLRTGVSRSDLRKVMFHLHMTREQWEPWAQCKALWEVYSELKDGLRIDEKKDWAKKIARETGMEQGTARDRISVLCWPKHLKEKIDKFKQDYPASEIYSYVLAIEASIVEPSLKAFPEFYNHTKKGARNALEHKVNIVRERLLDKTIQEIEIGTVTTREFIRAIDPIFTASLEGTTKTVARQIFSTLVERRDYSYEDARSEIAIKLPEVLAEKPPKPRRVIGLMNSLTRILEGYEPTYIRAGAKHKSTQRKLRGEFVAALKELATAIGHLQDKL